MPLVRKIRHVWWDDWWVFCLKSLIVVPYYFYVNKIKSQVNIVLSRSPNDFDFHLIKSTLSSNMFLTFCCDLKHFYFESGVDLPATIGLSRTMYIIISLTWYSHWFHIVTWSERVQIPCKDRSYLDLYWLFFFVPFFGKNLSACLFLQTLKNNRTTPAKSNLAIKWKTYDSKHLEDLWVNVCVFPYHLNPTIPPFPPGNLWKLP